MSAPIDNGGPAFPIPGMPPVGTGDPRDGMAGGCGPQPGMDLRDWFAGQALAGITTNTMIWKTLEVYKGPSEPFMAIMAYRLADAMISARKGVTP